MAQKTNSRQLVAAAVSVVLTPSLDVCKCGHDGTHHGTTGACRFGTTHGCLVFTSAE